MCVVFQALCCLTWIILFNPLSKPVSLELLHCLFTDDDIEAYGDKVLVLGSHW